MMERRIRNRRNRIRWAGKRFSIVPAVGSSFLVAFVAIESFVVLVVLAEGVR